MVKEIRHLGIYWPSYPQVQDTQAFPLGLESLGASIAAFQAASWYSACYWPYIPLPSWVPIWRHEVVQLTSWTPCSIILRKTDEASMPDFQAWAGINHLECVRMCAPCKDGWTWDCGDHHHRRSLSTGFPHSYPSMDQLPVWPTACWEFHRDNFGGAFKWTIFFNWQVVIIPWSVQYHAGSPTNMSSMLHCSPRMGVQFPAS